MPSEFLGKISDIGTTLLTSGLGEGFAQQNARQKNHLKEFNHERNNLLEANNAPIAAFSSTTRPTKKVLTNFHLSPDILSAKASNSGLSLSRNAESGSLQLQPINSSTPIMSVSLQSFERRHNPSYPTAYRNGDSLIDLMTHQAVRNFESTEGRHSSDRVFSGTIFTINDVPKNGAAKDGVANLIYQLAGQHEKANVIIGARIPTGLTGMVFPDKKVVSDPSKNDAIDWPNGNLASPPPYE